MARAAGAADTIYSGGPILTMDDANPRVEAVAAAGGLILLAGTAAEVNALKGPDTKIVDPAGRTMLPGFVDPHGHLTGGGLQALSANLLAPPDARSPRSRISRERCVTGPRHMPMRSNLPISSSASAMNSRN